MNANKRILCAVLAAKDAQKVMMKFRAMPEIDPVFAKQAKNMRDLNMRHAREIKAMDNAECNKIANRIGE